MTSSSAYSPNFPTLEGIRAERSRRASARNAAQNRDAIRQRCKALVGFIREAWHVLEPTNPYVHGWHIDEYCRHLEAISSGDINRFLANIPPGTMKSLILGVFWPAWEWGPNECPSLRYLSTSYSADYAKRDARKMRDLVASDWYQSLWGDTVRLKRSGEMSFENTAGGWREAVPFIRLTGGRGDRVLIDDPHSTENAESAAERASTLRIFRESVPLRMVDPATSAIIIVMQRLHEGDVSGAALALKLGYVHLMLPMEFERGRVCETFVKGKLFFRDPRTHEGELLFPERFPREVVERDKIAMGAYAVAGQFQQRPGPRGGGLFKREWFEIVGAAPADVHWVRGWDLAATRGDPGSVTGPAWTAGVKMGRSASTKKIFIADVRRLRGSPNDVENAIVNTASQDGKQTQISIPQDPGQAGKAQAQYLVGALVGYRVHTSPETGDKVARADPVASQAQAGNVKIIAGPWNDAFLDEVALFPNGNFLDQVDAMSRAFALIVAGPRPFDSTGITLDLETFKRENPWRIR